jgi:hypothetical protein
MADIIYIPSIITPTAARPTQPYLTTTDTVLAFASKDNL